MAADVTLEHLRALADASARYEYIDGPVPTAMLRDVLDALDAAQRSAAQPAAAAVDAARDLGHVVATERARADAAEGECARLRERLRSERAFAERMFERVPSDEDAVLMFVGALAGRASAAPNFVEWRGEHEGRGLTVTAQWADGKTPGEVIAAARADRDAAVAQREALAGAVRREREAEAYHREAVAECERCLSKPRAWWDRAKLEEERAAASLEDARRTLRAALDALLTEGTRSVADEAECDDCGDDMASGYFDPMARCPRHRP